MSDFVEYKPMDVEHNVKAAVENMRKAYWSNEPEKVAKAFTEAKSIIVSAICHDTYTVCKPYEERTQGEYKTACNVLLSLEQIVRSSDGWEDSAIEAVHNAVQTAIKCMHDRPKGEWALLDEWVNGVYTGGFYHVNCPVIEEGYKKYTRWTTDFCPNCGAPMLKGGEE